MRALAALLLAAGVASGCASSPEDSCNDVSGKICERLATCESRDAIFASQEQCVSSFNGYFEVDASDDAGCRETWSATQDLECADFLDYFRI